MSLTLIVTNLTASDNRTIKIVQTDSQVIVHFGDWIESFRTLAKALQCLGGMIPWEEWNDDSRASLNELNNGRGAI